MVSHDPAKCGDHRHCGSGDIMFELVKRKILDALASIPHYYSIRHYSLFLKDIG